MCCRKVSRVLPCVSHMDCRSFTLFSSVLHLPFRARTSFCRPSTSVISSSLPLASDVCHQQSTEQECQQTYVALPLVLYLPERQIFLLGVKDRHPISLPSEPAFPWLCVLPQLPLDRECLPNCLEHPPKKRADASSFCYAGSEMRILYLLNCLTGCEMLLPSCPEWCFPSLSCLEGQNRQMACILGSQLPK